MCYIELSPNAVVTQAHVDLVEKICNELIAAATPVFAQILGEQSPDEISDEVSINAIVKLVLQIIIITSTYFTIRCCEQQKVCQKTMSAMYALSQFRASIVTCVVAHMSPI